MAGLLDFLASFMQPPQATVVGDGVTYGPAVSRITRTPIQFSNSLGVAGQYDPNSKSITVNPANANDVGAVIRHESVHAALDSPALAALMQGPQAQSLMARMPKFIGDAQAELPAYLATNEAGARTASGYGTEQFPPADRKAALDEIIQSMPRHYPASTAAAYRRLITK